MLQLPYKYRGPATSQKTRENDWDQEPNMAPATYMLLVSAFVVGLLNGTGVINVTGVIHGTGVIMMLDNPPWNPLCLAFRELDCESFAAIVLTLQEQGHDQSHSGYPCVKICDNSASLADLSIGFFLADMR